MKKLCHLCFSCALALLQSLACAAEIPVANSIETIRVFPEEMTFVGKEQAHHIITTGEGIDAFAVDMTDAVAYDSDRPEVAQVEEGGIVRAGAPGEAKITVSSKRGLTATVTVRVRAAPSEMKLSFVNDVLPILSKAGCNSGKCHAKPEGQNGFKLSVFAYDPGSDYREIVKDVRGRRVFPAFPEESLILRKATLAIPHEGGERFKRGSLTHKTLVDWISEGMPYSNPGEPSLERIDIFPTERRYRKGTRQRLLVRAHYSDGNIEDVTSLAEFSSNNDEMAAVDQAGHVSVQTMNGETAIIARFMGLVSVSRVIVPSDRFLPESMFSSLPSNSFIDELAYEWFRKLGLYPSGLCSDSEFLRRASLDVIGVLPTANEARDFLENRSEDKRSRLIERLLNSPVYADYWAGKWADLIRPNPDRVGVKSVYMLDQWLRESFRQNRPYDSMVREIVTAQGSTHRVGPTVVFRDRRTPADVSTLVSQVFLGVRMECARCHHHPNEKWSQNDFYQFAAFFGEIKRKGAGVSPPISGDFEVIYHKSGGQVKHPVTSEVMSPKAPDGPMAQIPGGADPRVNLADWMCQPNNPFFAKALVNRMWAEFFGRGFVDPVDDFRASNPAANEPLLNALAEDFIRHGYDLKHLMETIMRSRLYQLSALPNEHNLEDARNFSRSYRRRLPAEVLLDGVGSVTGTLADFQGLAAGSKAKETWNYKISSEFMDAFGRPNSSSDCPCERDSKSSVVQALHLMNSSSLQDRIEHKQGRARELAESGRSTAEIITELYLSAFSRFPTAEELSLASRAYSVPESTRQTATEDVLWALLNTAEFVFNH